MHKGRSLLARAVIHHGVVVGAVVVIGQVPGGEGLKVVAAGEHLGDVYKRQTMGSVLGQVI